MFLTIRNDQTKRKQSPQLTSSYALHQMWTSRMAKTTTKIHPKTLVVCLTTYMYSQSHLVTTTKIRLPRTKMEMMTLKRIQYNLRDCAKFHAFIKPPQGFQSSFLIRLNERFTLRLNHSKRWNWVGSIQEKFDALAELGTWEEEPTITRNCSALPFSLVFRVKRNLEGTPSRFNEIIWLWGNS